MNAVNITMANTNVLPLPLASGCGRLLAPLMVDGYYLARYWRLGVLVLVGQESREILVA